MRSLLLLAGIFSGVAFAADGPQNSGILTIDVPASEKISAQLQMDVKVLPQLLGESTEVSEALVGRIFAVSHAGRGCPVRIRSQLASPDVINLVMELTCASKPMAVEIRIAQPESLPEGFSLGVRTVSGHFSLDRSSPSVEAIVNQTYLYFAAGLGFMGLSDLPDRIMLNRQAALWWGGAHRLPAGVGFVLLSIVVALSRLAIRSKILAIGASLPTMILPAFVILETGRAQAIHSLLYVSHAFYLTLAILAWTCVTGRRSMVSWATIVLIVFAYLIYGIELSTMLWPLEKPELTGRLSAIVGFVVGLNLVSWSVVAITLGSMSFVQWTRGVTQVDRLRLRAKDICMYAILIIATYLFVSAFVRVRI